MEYRIDDKQLDTGVFIAFVNKVWPGKYDEGRTAEALSRTLNITAYDGETLVGCLRILTDGYFFGTDYRNAGAAGISETGNRQQASSAGQRKYSDDAVFRSAADGTEIL